MPVVLGILLSIIHYYSEFFHKHCSKKTIIGLFSFVAGVSVSYLFLYLLPELTRGVGNLDRLLFFFLLIGFTLFHIVEKYIYQHEKGKARTRELHQMHTITFFVYHILVGVVLVRLASLSQRDMLLFFIPIALHSAISSFSLKEVHNKIRHETRLTRIILSVSPLLGVFFALNVVIQDLYFYAALGFLGGALLYIVVRDSIPRGTKGKPFYFFIGAFLYAMVVFLTQLF